MGENNANQEGNSTLFGLFRFYFLIFQINPEIHAWFPVQESLEQD